MPNVVTHDALSSGRSRPEDHKLVGGGRAVTLPRPAKIGLHTSQLWSGLCRSNKSTRSSFVGHVLRTLGASGLPMPVLRYKRSLDRLTTGKT